MRKKLYFSIFMLVSTVLCGCEGSLNPSVYDKLTSDNFPKTESGC